MNNCNNENYIVYLHTFPNDKKYIGITGQNPQKRWDNGRGYNNNSYMKNAIKKYGWQNIKHDILFSDLTKNQAEEKEIELISLYKSNDRNFGYNIQNGGNSKGKVSNATKTKISNANKGKNCYWYGKHCSDETKQKIIDKQFKKRVYCIETDTIYNSIRECARLLNINRSLIMLVCNKKRNHTHNYHFEYISNNGGKYGNQKSSRH